MKKLYTSLLALSLVLGAAACSNDDSSEDKDSSKDDQSKTEQKDKASNDHSKDKSSDKEKDKGDKNKDKDKNDNVASNNSNSTSNNQDSDHNQQATSNDNGSSSDQQAQNANGNNNSATNNNQQPSNNNDQGSSNQSTQSTQGTNGYVAPYHGTNAANVARSLTRDNVNQSEALKQLPNFQTALDIAKQEANLYGNHNKTYNDYGIEGNNGNYRYVFSFKDRQQNGVYSVVTLNSQGQPVVVDPAYGK